MDFPYAKFVDTKLWKVIDKAIADLEKNSDLELTTHRKYIVGYLCKRLARRIPISKRKLAGTQRPKELRVEKL